MNRVFLPLACGLALLVSTFAQTASAPNEGFRVIKIGPDAYTVFWWGRTGRTYFLQYSEDLVNWYYFPDDYLGLVLGENAVVSRGFSISGPTRFFLRLKYPDPPLPDPVYGDFDGDKVPNIFEILVGTDPFSVADTDGDGMSDDWETRFGLDPENPADATAGPASDPDGDGISNLAEYQTGALGTDPTDYYNGIFPSIVPFGWTQPIPWDEPGTAVAAPLVFEFKYGATLAQDVPVQVAVDYPSSGQISLTNDGNGLTSALNLRTGTNGRVQVYFKHATAIPPVPTARTIFARAGSTVPTGLSYSGRAYANVQSPYDYPLNTVGRNATDAVDARLAGKTAATALPVFSTQFHGTPVNPTPIYVRNTASWCYDLRQQMTCISPWNKNTSSSGDPTGPRGAGTAVTAQHIITSAHYGLQHGTEIRFITADNQVETRFIRGRATHPDYYSTTPHGPADITIYTLNSPLPATITPCKLLPANYTDYLSYLKNGSPPLMILDQEEKALVWEINALSDLAEFVQPGLHRKRVEFFESIVNGDSSNPEFLLLNDTLVLLSVMSGITQDSSLGYAEIARGTFVTPQISILNAMIVAADADTITTFPYDQISTGLQVQTVDLSGFSPYTPPSPP